MLSQGIFGVTLIYSTVDAFHMITASKQNWFRAAIHGDWLTRSCNHLVSRCITIAQCRLTNFCDHLPCSWHQHRSTITPFW